MHRTRDAGDVLDFRYVMNGLRCRGQMLWKMLLRPMR
jgi:hypothetical protein